MQYTVRAEWGYDDLNGVYRTYALAGRDGVIHDVSLDAAFARRAADLLNRGGVSGAQVWEVLDDLYTEEGCRQALANRARKE